MADQQEHNAPTDIVFNKFSNGPAVKQKSLRCNDQLEDLLIGISQWPMDVAKPFSAFWQCLKSKPGDEPSPHHRIEKTKQQEDDQLA